MTLGWRGCVCVLTFAWWWEGRSDVSLAGGVGTLDWRWEGVTLAWRGGISRGGSDVSLAGGGGGRKE